MDAETQYSIIAVRYGVARSTKSALYYRYQEYEEPDAAQDMDFFFYVLNDGSRTIVVDSGFKPESAARRPGRHFVTPPREALAMVGCDPCAVEQVIVTHFHWDHIGNLDHFPNATLSVGHEELAFWTDPIARNLQFWAHADADTIDYVVAAHRDGRAVAVGRDEEVAPGIRAITVGGHSFGQQLLVVNTARGRVVLASDATHLYEEMMLGRPFGVAVDIAKMCRAYEMLRRMQAEGATIVPGHDPEVTQRFPTLEGDGAGVGYVIA